jgi:hypothetical protein
LRCRAPSPACGGRLGWGCQTRASCESFPRPAALPTKISKTTPCKVAWCRWRGCFERSATTFDTSGKSAALFHHRAIVKRPCYERRPPRKRERQEERRSGSASHPKMLAQLQALGQIAQADCRPMEFKSVIYRSLTPDNTCIVFVDRSRRCEGG